MPPDMTGTSTWVAIACTIWACYAGLLGFIGGKTFEDDHTKAFLVAFGMARLGTDAGGAA